MRCLVVLLLLANLSVTCFAQSQGQAGQFNIFKSYANAKVRPVQYARVNRKHAIGEYLDSTQKKMMKYRNGPDSPNLMWTDKGWNGNKKDNTNMGETRRLADTGSSSSSSSRSNLRVGSGDVLESGGSTFSSIFLFGAIALIIVLVATSHLWSRRTKAVETKPLEQDFVDRIGDVTV